MIHQSPPFVPLTSYPLVIWYPQGPVAQKVFEEPSSCRFPSRRKIITLNIFLERERFFLLFSWVYLFLFGSPFFSYPLFSLLFLFCEQSNWEPAWNEWLNERKRKKLVWTSIILSSTFAFWSEEYFVKNSRFMPNDRKCFLNRYSLCKTIWIYLLIMHLKNSWFFLAFSNWFQVFW